MTSARAEIPAPYSASLVVKPEWLDPNGHMNVAYYLSAFDDGGEPFFADFGLDWNYTRAGVGSVFMLSSTLDFRRELFADSPIRVDTRLVDHSDKLLHTYQALYHAEDQFLAATMEAVYVHISLATRRSTPMPAVTLDRLAAIAPIHAALGRPDNLGRVPGIRRS